MIIYEEEYRVQVSKIKEWERNHLEFDEMVKGLDAPFLKGWYVWQERFTPGLIRNVWIFDELGDIDKMWELGLVRHPKFPEMIPKIFETMVDGSYKYRLWKPVSNEEIEASLKED